MKRCELKSSQIKKKIDLKVLHEVSAFKVIFNAENLLRLNPCQKQNPFFSFNPEMKS